MEKVVSSLRRISDGVLFWALAIAGIGLLFAVLGLPVMRQRQTMEAMAREMSRRNASLDKHLGQLRKERVALESDPFYVEKLARRSLKMSRPGEMEVRTSTTHSKKSVHGEKSRIPGNQTTELVEFHGMFMALTEDNLIRQIAFALGCLSLFMAFVLFGRSPKHRVA